MANRRFIDFPIAASVGNNDIVLIWQDGLNKQTTKATLLQGSPSSLAGLTDVDISALTNGQILQYNSTTSKWENVDRTDINLSELGDVTIVAPANGQVLVYNSSTGKWENSSGGYVPYTGAVTTVDLGAQGLLAGYIGLDTSVASVPDEQGLIYWDASRSTAALIMNGTLQHIGQDTFFYVKNSTGSSISKGVAVRFDGTDGASGHIKIAPFLANGTYPSSYFMGVTAEAIANGAFGQVMHFGELDGINTSSYTAGDLLYASTSTAGGFQTTVPVAPNNIVLIAAAINSKNNGAIIVRPTYGSNINQDEGVKITSPTTGDLLQLQAGGLWENKTKAQILGGTSAQFVKGDGSLDSNTYGTGTVTSVGLSSATSGVTIGSTPVTTSGTITLAIATASGSQNGLLSSTDWTTFNGKQNALTNPVTGTGTSGRVAFWNGTNSITSDSDLLFDGSNVTVGGNIVLTNGVNRFVRIGSASNYNYDLQTTGDDFQIIEAGASIATPRLTIKYPNGNVLIGTTTDNGARLQVSGTATFSSTITATGDIRSNGNYRDYQNESLMTTNGSVNEFGSSAAGTPRSVTIFAGNAAALSIATNRVATFSSSVTITCDSGAIALALRARSNDDFSQINFLNNAGTNINGAIGLEKVGTNGGLMYFYTKPNGGSITEGARITAGGFFKASNTGTYASSTGSFHELMNSATGNNIAYLYNTSANPYGPYVRFSAAAPNNGTNYYLYFDDTSAARFIVYSNGGISNYQANNTNLSDERTKKEIAPLESYWDKFKNIEIVKFKYKDQTHDDFNIGVIAQQVEKVAPEFVDVDGWSNKTESNKNEIISQEEPIKSIYTADLHHATIKVLQEAMAKIESMQKEIDTLKN
jgi:hypothetical protein